MNRRYLYHTKQITIIAITTVMTFGIIEGALRFANRQTSGDDLVVRDSTGVRVLQSNLDTVIIGGMGTPVHITTNADGFASPPYPTHKERGVKRIAFLGNSFTQGFEVDEDKKFTSSVEQKLRVWSSERRGPTIQVLNFGIGGTSIVEQFFLYRTYVKKYHPDVVVLVSYAGYDYATNRRYLAEKEYLLSTPIDELSNERILASESSFNRANESWKTQLVKESEIVRYLIRLVQSHGALYEVAIRLGLLHRPLTQEVGDAWTQMWSYFNPDSLPHRELMEFTADLIRKFGDEVTGDGSRFVLITIPSYWQIQDKYLTELTVRGESFDPKLPNTITALRVGTTYPILDLSDRVDQAIDQDGEQVFIRDVGHFTGVGHMIAAETIARFLQNNAKRLQL